MDITLLKVLTIVGQNGYKTEVKNSRHISGIFLKDEDLWTTLANYQYNKYSSLLSLAICKAIESKDTAKAIKLIRRIAPFVSKDEEKNNPNKTFYKFKRYMSVFISAIKNKNMEVFNRMCNFGLTEKQTHSLMVCAIVNESILVIKYFISKNIDLNFHMLAEFSETCSAKMMKSSLNFGIESKNLEIVKLLIENGARSSVQEITIRYDSCYYNSLSPILICCISKDWDIFEYLLDNSNIVHFEELFDRLGVNGKVDLLKKLVKKHINKIKEVNPYVNEREIVQSNTLIPLFGSSLYFNKMEIYYYLLENFNIDLEVRYKIIRDLCILNKYDILDQFLTKYPGEITYFSYACEHESEEIIACLIKHGAYIHPLHESNPTLLTKIAERNFIGIAQLLLHKGIKINHQSNRGWTALMAAVTNGHKEMVQFLMDNGADQSLKNEHGRTVLEMAKYRNRVEIIKILES